MNLTASASYPFVQFVPTEGNKVQHTDQEYSDGSNNSYMFRIYNAEYDTSSGQWHTLTAGVSDAYATVQNPDGSIHYYWNNGVTTNFSWVGTDNNTVYNAIDFGLTAGGDDVDNYDALNTLFGVINGASQAGGTVAIPQYEFPVEANGLVPPINSIFQSLGTGGENGAYNTMFHFKIKDPDDATTPSTFLNCDNSNHTSGGTIFRNIAFEWTGSSINEGDTCLIFNMWNNIAQECTFTDCPTAIYFQGLQQSAKQCSINYGNNITTPTTNYGIILTGVQCEVSGPSEMDGGLTMPTTLTPPVPIGNAFMYICGDTSHCNHSTLRNLHIYNWNYGVDYSDINESGIGGGCQNIVIDGCHMEIYKTCINMQGVGAPDSDTLLFNQTIVNCNLQKGQDSRDGSPIVFIDSGGGLATNVGPVMLTNNLVFSNVTWDTDPMSTKYGMAKDNQYGVQIGTCADVSIMGGRISQMGGNTSGEGTTGSANICISGDPTGVTITAVDLNGVYPGANDGSDTGAYGSGPSEYALLIQGNPQIVKVTDCFMSGTTGNSVSITGNPETVRLTNCQFGASPLSVTGAPVSLIVRDCTGYNDLNTVIGSGVSSGDYPTSSTNTAATAGALSGGVDYYGPSLVVFSAGASTLTIHINGVASVYQELSSGTVFLNSPYDVFYFTGVPGHFEWIGK